MALPRVYKIHPAIGVARLGNAAPDEFFIGPETPGRPSEGDPAFGTTVPLFKTGGKIKRQAARYRIFEYVDNGKGKYKVAREVNLANADVKSIKWTVHLANKKAAFFEFDGLHGDPVLAAAAGPGKRRNSGPPRKEFFLDPGPRSISGKSLGPVEFRKGGAPGLEVWPVAPPTPPIEYLGELRTDSAGRLVVLGAVGLSSKVTGAAAISTYANNDGWYDDVSDGPVQAEIVLKSGKKTCVPAWVICGPPDFAPFAQNVVSLYDTLFDLFVREIKLPTNDERFDGGSLNLIRKVKADFSGAKLSTHKPDFDAEIWPILDRALAVTQLFAPAQYRHSTLGAGALVAMYKVLADPIASTGVRGVIFNSLRDPATGGAGTMPKLLGDDPYAKLGIANKNRLSLTATQFALMEQWSKGNFVAGGAAPPSTPPASITADGLDRAALENCVGGAFYPGIEASWLIRQKDLYLKNEIFRLDPAAKSPYLGDSDSMGPGFLSRQMALPWQADFLMCRMEGLWGWWPAQRPDFVYATAADAAGKKPMLDWTRPSGAVWPRGGTTPIYEEMVENWWKLAFVAKTAGDLHESERNASVP